MKISKENVKEELKIIVTGTISFVCEMAAVAAGIARPLWTGVLMPFIAPTDSNQFFENVFPIARGNADKWENEWIYWSDKKEERKKLEKQQRQCRNKDLEK